MRDELRSHFAQMIESLERLCEEVIGGEKEDLPLQV